MIQIISVIMMIFGFIFNIILMTLFFSGLLYGLIRLFNFKKKEFKLSVYIALIYFVVSFAAGLISGILLKANLSELIIKVQTNLVLVLTSVILISVVKYFYEENWLKTIIVSLIWLGILTLLGYLFSLFLMKILPNLNAVIPS